ncbi:MAG: hypothetical protein MO852_08040 [Candidatus Devosia euplotis]|nr:hypothetical protein [Candidatus Devosia euplotis]
MAADFTTWDWSEPPKDMSMPLQALVAQEQHAGGRNEEQAHSIVQATMERAGI